MVFRILQTVEMHEGGRSAWMLRSPNGMSLGWACDPVIDDPNKRLEWRASADAPVHSVLTAAFEQVEAGTELIVEWSVAARSGEQGGPGVETFLDENAQRMLDDDLRRLKVSLEKEGVRLAAEAEAASQAEESKEEEHDE